MRRAESKERERRKAQRLARDYEKQGFRVSVEPRGEQLPEFLRESSYKPDLIVEGPEESIVIEVTSRDSVERLRQLSDVSRRIRRQRGWEFMLVMTNARSPREPDFPVHLADINDLQDAFRRVEELYEQCKTNGGEYSHAILLSVWAIVEGVLRMYLYTGKRNSQQVRSAHSLVRDAVMLGFLELEEGRFFDRMASARNRVAHGVVTERVSAADLDRLVRECRLLLSTRG